MAELNDTTILPERFLPHPRNAECTYPGFCIRFVVLTGAPVAGHQVGWSAFMGPHDWSDERIRDWGLRVPLELARWVWPMEMFADYHQ